MENDYYKMKRVGANRSLLWHCDANKSNVLKFIRTNFYSCIIICRKKIILSHFLRASLWI